MKIYVLDKIKESELNRIKTRSFGRRNEVTAVVKNTFASIKKDGDKIIIEKYKKRVGNTYSLQITQKEIAAAYKTVIPSYIKALKQAIKNIETLHKAQLKRLKEPKTIVSLGISVWREWRPIEKVGLYVPGGKAVYPSSVLMTGIPAIIAGCKEIVLCSPPDEKCKIPAATLVAADMIGIKKIFNVGGIEAIAAMAYGTETIPKVYKIFGPGNSYVTEAKIQVYGDVDIDMPAGPSEVFIIADETANPAFVAADLLADGEHGEDSACVLVTTSGKLAQAVNQEIEKQLKELSTGDRIRKALANYGLLTVVKSLDEAITFSNDYAPEHLEIMTKNPEKVVSKITNAGSIFLGDWTTKSAGDYGTGANHVLPTGGMAKMFSPLSVDSFGKMMQVQKVASKNALANIKETIEVFGEIEELPAHKNAATIRFVKKYEKK